MHIVRLKISDFCGVGLAGVVLGRHAEKVAGGYWEQSAVDSEELRTKENQTIACGHKHCETIGIDLGGVTSLAEVVSHYETGSGSSLSAPVLSGVIASIDALAECFRWDDSSSGTVVRKWYRSLSSR